MKKRFGLLILLIMGVYVLNASGLEAPRKKDKLFNVPTGKTATMDPTAIEADTGSLTEVGVWGYGDCLTSFAYNNRLYVGTGRLMEIYDIADPESPSKLGSIALDNLVLDIYVEGNNALVIDSMHTYYILDIANPEHPVLKYSSNVLFVKDVYVRGNFAYFASIYYGLVILDISDSSNPVEVGRLFVENYFYNGVFLKDEYAFLTVSDRNSGENRLFVLNISNQSTPILVKDVYIGYYNIVHDISFSGDYICFPYGDGQSGGIIVFDVSTPTNPVKLVRKSFTEFSDPQAVVTIGECAFIADSVEGLVAIRLHEYLSNVLRKLSPKKKGFGLSITGDYVFMSSGYEGLQVVKKYVSISQSGSTCSLSLKNNIDNGSDIASMDVCGNNAYLLERYGNFKVLDFSQPNSPEMVSQINLTSGTSVGGGSSVVVTDDYSYVNIGGTLKIISNTAPSSPEEVGFIVLNGPIYAFCIVGNYVYAAYQELGVWKLAIVDVSNRESPSKVGSFVFPEGTGFANMRSEGKYLYVAGDNVWDGILYIFDISDPSSPIKITQMGFDESIKDFDVAGDHLFLIIGRLSNPNLIIIDVSDPNNPIEKSIFSPEGGVRIGCVCVKNDCAFLGSSAGNVMAIDVSNPFTPVELHTKMLPAAESIIVSGSYAYVSSQYCGFSVLDAIDSMRTITIVSPNSGEVLVPGSSHTITWMNTGSVENVTIEYSLTGINGVYEIITEATQNTGNFHWIAPNADSSNCFLRISNAEGTVSDVSDTAFSILPPPTLTLSSPNGGETWVEGSSHNITWTSCGTVSNVKIQYSTNGVDGSYTTIAESVANTGSYDWTAPDGNSSSCFVRISGNDETVYDSSDTAFTIQPLPELTLIIPNGGETWDEGSIETIAWTSVGAVGNVKIEYSTTGVDGSYSIIAESVANTGSYSWTVPDAESAQCFIRISSVDGTASDTNNASFSIQPQPELTMISPNGGEIFLIGSEYSITWASRGFSGNVKLEYSKTGVDGTYETIIESTPNTGSYPWTVPPGSSLNCFVRITGVDGTPVDISDNEFRIKSAVNIPSNERQALIDFYNSTNGDSWTSHLNWKKANGEFNDAGTEDTWEGVGTKYDHVTQLSFIDKNLTGTLPDSIQNFSQMKYITIIENDISGPIPSGIGNLTQLQSLTMTKCQLSGSIPLGIFGLTNLVELCLSENSLSGGIPADLGNLTQLVGLKLASNQLSGSIPAEIGNLVNLDTISLNNNQLTGSIPAEISNLTVLRNLYLNSNQLTGSIPGELGNLSNLETFFVGKNGVTGELPESLISVFSHLNHSDSFEYNGVHTNNTELRAALEAMRSGWESTQTIAPSDVSASAISANEIQISWTPIVYTANNGGYRVYYSTTPGGPYTFAGITETKTIAQLNVTGLDPGVYYFVVQTVSEPSNYNANTIESLYSEEVSSMTAGYAAITVATPNGGETWQAGSEHIITWTTVGTVANVKIEYSTAGADGTYVEIAGSVANTGSYQWTVPDADSSQCYIRISTIDGTVSDTSDTAFTITPAPVITVTAPNGGETWETGSAQSITWTAANMTGNVDIYLYKNNAQLLQMTTLPYDTGSYSWTIPADLTEGIDYTIRVSQDTLYDGSDSPFVISTPPPAVHPDFNGDGKVDLLWRRTTTGDNGTWLMNGTQRIRIELLNPLIHLQWRLAGTADINGDGKTDIIWRNRDTGQNAVWYMDGTQRTGNEYLNTLVKLEWVLAGLADFNGDGKADILWRNTITGQNGVWMLDGVSRTSIVFLNNMTNTNWYIGGLGDFNGDGHIDIAWRHQATGENFLWYMNGTTRIGTAVLKPLTNTAWVLAGVGDFNGDGKPDLIWRNPTTGENGVWFFDDDTYLGFQLLNSLTQPGWELAN